MHSTKLPRRRDSPSRVALDDLSVGLRLKAQPPPVPSVGTPASIRHAAPLPQ